MSDTDSFIDEVNEEVRRDKLYAALRRYGWIAALGVVVIVGAASWNEYRKAQSRAAAEAVGDAMLSALAAPEPGARLEALEAVPAQQAGSAAIAGFLRASQAEEAGQLDRAIAALDVISVDGEIPLIYRQIAAFKALTLQSDTLDADTLRLGFEAIAVPGAPLDLLAREQLALLDIREGDPAAALARYQAILDDAAATPDLQQRALQVMVALGGAPGADAGAASSN